MKKVATISGRPDNPRPPERPLSKFPRLSERGRAGMKLIHRLRGVNTFLAHSYVVGVGNTASPEEMAQYRERVRYIRDEYSKEVARIEARERSYLAS